MMGPMKVMLSLAVAFAFVAASAAYGTRAAPRIWLVSPTVVRGSGFPMGKVTVKAQTRVVVVRVSRTGRFTARFVVPIKAAGCQVAAVTAIGARGTRATLKVPGSARDCPPPIER